MYKLYYSPGACSMAVHVVLNEINQPVTLEKIDIHAPRPPEFLKLNPHGSVPVLVDDDMVIREGLVILSYLADKHQSPLLPREGKDRLLAMQWLAFCNATLHPGYSRCFFLMRNAKAEKDALLGTSIAMINKLWDEVENRLAQSAFLAGDNITLADILMTVIANWKTYFPDPEAIKPGPRTKKLFQTVSSRPAFQKAMEIEHVAYKAAA